MAGYRFTPEADTDLFEIWSYIPLTIPMPPIGSKPRFTTPAPCSPSRP